MKELKFHSRVEAEVLFVAENQFFSDLKNSSKVTFERAPLLGAFLGCSSWRFWLAGWGRDGEFGVRANGRNSSAIRL